MPRGQKPRNPKLPKAGEPGYDTQRHHSMPMTRLRRDIYGLLAHMQPDEIQELIEILEKRKVLDEDVRRVVDAAIRRRRSGRSC